MDSKIGVIAGTLVDTQMGVDFLDSKGVNAEAYPISKTPKEQSRLQLLEADLLYKIVVEKVQAAKKIGTNKFFIYCNSLSAAVDMEKVSEETDTYIITPFAAYADLAGEFSRPLIMAANGKSCGRIEAVFEQSNKDIEAFSISLLPLVEEIEKGLSEKEIYDTLNLEGILNWAKGIHTDGIILGCTHFPYIFNVLSERTTIPIVDPSEKMFEMLINVS